MKEIKKFSWNSSNMQASLNSRSCWCPLGGVAASTMLENMNVKLQLFPEKKEKSGGVESTNLYRLKFQVSPDSGEKPLKLNENISLNIHQKKEASG